MNDLNNLMAQAYFAFFFLRMPMRLCHLALENAVKRGPLGDLGPIHGNKSLPPETDIAQCDRHV